MECLFGITGPDYCILAADCTLARSIVVMKGTEEKFRRLTRHAVLAYSGEPGDATNYADYVTANLHLDAIRASSVGYDSELGREQGVAGAAAFARKTLADALRSRTPYNVNVLIGGINPDTNCAELYWMDYLASMVKVPFAAHGYGAYFCAGLMDRMYREDMSAEEAKDMLKACLKELKTRFVVNLPLFSVRIIRSDGSIESQTLSV